jgi:hypothetical protein
MAQHFENRFCDEHGSQVGKTSGEDALDARYCALAMHGDVAYRLLGERVEGGVLVREYRIATPTGFREAAPGVAIEMEAEPEEG